MLKHNFLTGSFLSLHLPYKEIVDKFLSKLQNIIFSIFKGVNRAGMFYSLLEGPQAMTALKDSTKDVVIIIFF